MHGITAIGDTMIPEDVGQVKLALCNKLVINSRMCSTMSQVRNCLLLLSYIHAQVYRSVGNGLRSNNQAVISL